MISNEVSSYNTGRHLYTSKVIRKNTIDCYLLFYCCDMFGFGDVNRNLDLIAKVCLTGDVRLGGGTSSARRVEICVDEVWGTICDDFWSDAEASIVCAQLGFSKKGYYI